MYQYQAVSVLLMTDRLPLAQDLVDRPQLHCGTALRRWKATFDEFNCQCCGREVFNCVSYFLLVFSVKHTRSCVYVCVELVVDDALFIHFVSKTRCEVGCVSGDPTVSQTMIAAASRKGLY